MKPLRSPARQSARATPDTALLEAFWREPVQRVVLPNGVTVVLKPDAAAALALIGLAVLLAVFGLWPLALWRV
jgi:hypothetical protein